MANGEHKKKKLANDQVRWPQRGHKKKTNCAATAGRHL